MTEPREPHGIARVILVDWLAATLWLLFGAVLCLTIVGIYPGFRCIRRGFRILHQANLDIIGRGGKLGRTTPVGRAFGYRDRD